MAAMDGCGIQSSRTWQNEERLRDDVSLNCAYRISQIGFDLRLGAMLLNTEDFYEDDGITVCDGIFFFTNKNHVSAIKHPQITLLYLNSRNLVLFMKKKMTYLLWLNATVSLVE